MDKHSYLSNANGAVIEDLYNQYLINVNNVEEGWRKFFDGFEYFMYFQEGLALEF